MSFCPSGSSPPAHETWRAPAVLARTRPTRYPWLSSGRRRGLRRPRSSPPAGRQGGGGKKRSTGRSSRGAEAVEGQEEEAVRSGRAATADGAIRPARSPAVRRRDRHGRGLRGRLVPPGCRSTAPGRSSSTTWCSTPWRALRGAGRPNWRALSSRSRKCRKRTSSPTTASRFRSPEPCRVTRSGRPLAPGHADQIRRLPAPAARPVRERRRAQRPRVRRCGRGVRRLPRHRAGVGRPRLPRRPRLTVAHPLIRGPGVAGVAVVLPRCRPRPEKGAGSGAHPVTATFAAQARGRTRVGPSRGVSFRLTPSPGWTEPRPPP